MSKTIHKRSVTSNVKVTSDSLIDLKQFLIENDKQDIEVIDSEWVFDLLICGKTEALVGAMEKIPASTVVVFDNITAIEDVSLADMAQVLDALVNNEVIGVTHSNSLDNGITNLFLNGEWYN
jgi:hypothetical protein